jgi:hypothetical protein
MTDCNIHVESHHSQPAIKSRKQEHVSIDVWPDGNQTVPTCKDDNKLADLFSAHGGNGVIFCTYNLLRAGVGKLDPLRNEDNKAYIERATRALEKPGTRFMQVLEWLQVFTRVTLTNTCACFFMLHAVVGHWDESETFRASGLPQVVARDGMKLYECAAQADKSAPGPLIVLDECHKAKVRCAGSFASRCVCSHWRVLIPALLSTSVVSQHLSGKSCQPSRSKQGQVQLLQRRHLMAQHVNAFI